MHEINIHQAFVNNVLPLKIYQINVNILDIFGGLKFTSVY